MRLRNIPRAEGVLKECSQVIETPEEFRGHWASDVFQNDYPVHIEIGMGKGRFLMALAQKNPQINYIGIERYTSVLLRAVEKLNIIYRRKRKHSAKHSLHLYGRTGHSKCVR